MERPEGLRRDLLLCYDLVLPEDFSAASRPMAKWRFRAVAARARAGAVRDTDDFKFNVNLVLIDLFLRRNLIAGDEAARLRAALAVRVPGAPV